MYAAMAISAASAVVGYEDQKQSAAAQTTMIEDGYAQEQQQTLRQYQEQSAVAIQDTSERHRETLIEEGRLKAIGAESGLAGVTNDRIVAESKNQGSKDIATILSNLQRQTEQTHSQAGSKQAAANVQLASVRKPSSLGLGLQLGATAVSAYSQYKKPVTKP
jgi:hypothetical protein